MTKIPTELDEAYVSSFAGCYSPCDRTGGKRYIDFLSAYPISLCRKERVVLIQLLKKPS